MARRFNQPLGGNQMPRFGGPATMMRLPSCPRPGARCLFVGVPFDIGTSNRSGARFGPRQIRRRKLPDPAIQHGHTRCTLRQPVGRRYRRRRHQHLQSAQKRRPSYEKAYDEILGNGCKPLTLGGDHTIALPILRAMARSTGRSAWSMSMPTPISTTACSASPSPTARPSAARWSEGLLDGKRVAQIGLRATGYAADDFDWPRDQGFRVVQAEECWHKSLTPLMDEVRAQFGRGPVYLTFDIDRLDPCSRRAPGRPRSAASTRSRESRSFEAAGASKSSAATWSRSRRPMTPQATQQSRQPISCSKCSASCRAFRGVKLCQSRL